MRAHCSCARHGQALLALCGLVRPVLCALCGGRATMLRLALAPRMRTRARAHAPCLRVLHATATAARPRRAASPGDGAPASPARAARPPAAHEATLPFDSHAVAYGSKSVGEYVAPALREWRGVRLGAPPVVTALAATRDTRGPARTRRGPAAWLRRAEDLQLSVGGAQQHTVRPEPTDAARSQQAVATRALAPVPARAPATF